jgi:hypothetical protein
VTAVLSEFMPDDYKQLSADHRLVTSPRPGSLSGPLRTCGERSDVGQRCPWRTILIVRPAKLFAFVIMATSTAVLASYLNSGVCTHKALVVFITWPANIAGSAGLTASLSGHIRFILTPNSGLTAQLISRILI